MLNVGIFCSDTGWIYDQFISAFEKYSKHKIVRNPKGECDIYYYIPYYELPKEKHILRPSCVWMSHQESKSPLKEKFVSAAKQSDMAISHSKKYADMLKNEYGINNVMQIIPGVDITKYKMRGTDRFSKTTNLIVGYSGRPYQSSNRKNPALLKQISELPFVEFRFTGGKIKLGDLPEFYSDCDIIVQPSIIEGGSMAIQESLAVGTPIMCFKDVGVAQEFHAGVIKAAQDDKDDFLSRLEVFWRTKEYEQYRHPGIMQQMRGQVISQTWECFVRKHDIVWESLV